MISRCPSCAAQVADDAARCPSCHWDFNARRRILPAAGAKEPGAAKPSPPPPSPDPPKPAEKQALPSAPGLRVVPFSETLGTMAPRKVPPPASAAPPKAPPPAPASPPKEPPPVKATPVEPPLGLHQFPKIDQPTPRRSDPDESAAQEEKPKFSLPPARNIPLDAPPAPAAKAAAKPPVEPPPPAKAPAKESAREPASEKPKAPPAEKAKEPPAAKPAKTYWFSRKASGDAAAAKAPEAAAAKPNEAPARPSLEPPKTVRRQVSAGPPKPVERPKPKAEPDAKAKAPAKPAREEGRPGSSVSWAGLAAGVVIAAATALVFVNMRPDAGVMNKASRSTAAIFAKGAASVRLDAAKLLDGADDHRDIRNIQRVALDPQQPAAGAVPLPPPPPLPAAAPAPIPPSPPAPAPAAAAPRPQPPSRPAPEAPRAPTVVLLSSIELPRNDAGSRLALKSQEEPAAPLWTFEGSVYDLVSRRPVFGARLRFLKPDGEMASETSTDSKGAFKVALDPLPETGYRMVIAHPDYEFYLDEIDPPFRSMSRADRLAAATIHTSNHPWRGVSGSTKQRIVVAIPKNLPEE